MPNFDKISQSTAEIKLLPVLENGRPPYWNFISGLDFDLCIVISIRFCICLPNFVIIGWSSADLWRHIHFFKMAAGNILPFWLETAYSRPFLGCFGGIFPPNMAAHCSNPQKALPYAETRCLSHKAWKSVQRFDLGAFPRKKDRTGQDSQTEKSQSCNISPIWGEAPTVPIRTKICMVCSLDVITFAKFQVEIFWGYDFTGVEFPIFLLNFAWVLQQCNATALPVIFWHFKYVLVLRHSRSR